MLYIEGIPRTLDGVVHQIDSEDIEVARKWIREHCDLSKRYVISEYRRGPVLGDGIVEPVYFGWDHQKQQPRHVKMNYVSPRYNGFRTFSCAAAATEHYQACEAVASKKLEKDALAVQAAFKQLSSQGVFLDVYATAADDHGLECGFEVSASVEGFLFRRRVTV